MPFTQKSLSPVSFGNCSKVFCYQMTEEGHRYCVLGLLFVYLHQGLAPTKEHAQAGPEPPCTCVTDVQLGPHVKCQTTGTGAITKAVACMWDMFFYLGHLAWPQWERKHLASQRLGSVGVKGGGVPMCSAEKRGWGKGCRRG